MLPRLLPDVAHRCVKSLSTAVFKQHRAMRMMGSTDLMWQASASLTARTRDLCSCNRQQRRGVSRSQPRTQATLCRNGNQHSRLYAAAVEDRAGSSCSPASHLQREASAAVEPALRQEERGRPKLQLRPGEVHVWWLFPEDVRMHLLCNKLHACHTRSRGLTLQDMWSKRCGAQDSAWPSR